MTHRLLLADDSVTIQKVVELTFSDEDFEIIAVGDGSAALEKIRDGRPDIILSDVIMPGLNGYDLCARVKQDSDLRRIPFIFLRGTFESFDEDRARAAGADDFIVKPFESQELVEKVKGLIAKAKAAPPPVQPTVMAAPPIQPAAQVPPPRPPVQPTIQAPTYTPPVQPPIQVTPPRPPVQPTVQAPPYTPPPEPSFSIFEEPAVEEFPAFAAPAPPPPPPAPPAFGGFGAFEEPAAKAEEISEEDLWSEVKISDHPIPKAPPVPPPAAAFPTQAAPPPFREEFLEEEASPFEPAAPEAEVPGLFSAAVTKAEPWPAAAEPTPPPPTIAAPAAPGADELKAVLEAKVEEILRAVAPDIIREVTHRVISEVAWEVVPDTAEKLIREEIDRLTRGGA